MQSGGLQLCPVQPFPVNWASKNSRMLKRFVLLIGIGCFVLNVAAQVQSPQAFLGYPVGSRYTPHWKVLDYFKHVARQAPSMVQLQTYGATNEGRELLVAIVSSAENMKNIDGIRQNNMRLAGLARDKMAPMEDHAPAIVWLSYNVHGNETSSSEAAMLTLFALVDPANTNTKSWLQNTVVVIDPCMNPDGRDRYVNWFNSVVGVNANPLPVAREHNEPWPGGRTNHYNFDLNRDWAWQTQLESQQRMKLYNEWLPQVHVDFHEQYINDPYYFAPAAEPFHEVITPWQREFQNTVGKNNARYFDKNGWLFYTREYFDLFYPSYGDTYPLYNGAIGMTYEQAGHSTSGTAIITDEGDTLTLYDRVQHHYTTGLSTIEVASQNADRLIREYHRFFSNAIQNGVGEYKSFVIKKEPGNEDRIHALLQLLDRNRIQYGTGSGSGKGYNYATGKEENFPFATGDIIINTNQPKGTLVKVLFEPKSKLVDSATYDITAWSVPYAYGLTAFASREKLNAGPGLTAGNAVQNAGTTYGYVIRWNGVSTVKLVGELLRRKILLRYEEQPFDVDGQHFDRGSILVLRTANKAWGESLFTNVKAMADAAGVQLYPITTGFVDKGHDFGSDKVHPLRAPRVALLTGEGVNSGTAGEIWHFFDKELQYPITLINASDVDNSTWKDIDVLLLVGGSYKFLADKGSLEAFKDWISNGGRVVAMGGGVEALAKAELGIKLKKDDAEKKGDEDDTDTYAAIKRFEDRERDFLPNTIPGSIYKVELDTTHPLAYGYPAYYYTLRLDDNIYEFLKGGGWNVGIIRKDNQVAGFVGSRLKNKLKDGLLFGVVQKGGGSITCLADDVLFRDFWENGKLMFCNAVFLVGN